MSPTTAGEWGETQVVLSIGESRRQTGDVV